MRRIAIICGVLLLAGCAKKPPVNTTPAGYENAYWYEDESTGAKSPPMPLISTIPADLAGARSQINAHPCIITIPRGRALKVGNVKIKPVQDGPVGDAYIVSEGCEFEIGQAR